MPLYQYALALSLFATTSALADDLPKYFELKNLNKKHNITLANNYAFDMVSCEKDSALCLKNSFYFLNGDLYEWDGLKTVYKIISVGEQGDKNSFKKIEMTLSSFNKLTESQSKCDLSLKKQPKDNLQSVSYKISDFSFVFESGNEFQFNRSDCFSIKAIADHKGTYSMKLHCVGPERGSSKIKTMHDLKQITGKWLNIAEQSDHLSTVKDSANQAFEKAKDAQKNITEQNTKATERIKKEIKEGSSATSTPPSEQNKKSETAK